MTLTIEVPPELEIKLEAEARKGGISKDEFVRVVLEEKLNAKKAPPLTDYGRIIATDLPIRDFTREHGWLEKNREQYDGQYVALDGDRLLAHGENGKEVAAKIKELGLKSVYIVFVEGPNRPLLISGGVW
ncbi:MAG TPA: DUF5678 domain-containing protein [Pyrinomonadaceae bacterium]|nr:DUF5678 domain-containing protein [Pyrinomonadaceae bacterium]